jgi:hypothetical protein
MAEEKFQSDKGQQRKQSSKDITPILRGWEYEAGAINVRKIVGTDGQPKLQMRLDLGLLQMELDGRPDGSKPHGCESLLDYSEKRLRDHRRRTGTDDGFHLSPSQCQSLREEALMYYHRYLSLFVLGDFAAVARDTQRNLRVLDFCGKFASDEEDRLVLEQYRPYVIMMHTRALATIETEAGRNEAALALIRRGLKDIKRFFKRFGHLEAYKRANEVRVLKQFGRQLLKRIPVDPIRKLEKELERAIQDERYEEAARLRDELEQLRPRADGEAASGGPDAAPRGEGA